VAAGLLLAAPGRPARADQVIADDLIVTGSLCVGIPCQVGEDFAFDSIILKGDVLGLRFLDTSSSASFPTRDWAITVNDADGAGTMERFSVEDVDASTIPFTIEGGAPSHALYIGADGVGIGTPAPAAGAALDVNGSLRVDGSVIVSGLVGGLTGVKAGVIPKAEFSHGRARVTFAAPYAGPYVVLLTPVSKRQSATFRPAVLRQDADGFTVSRGGLFPAALVEIHWMTQPVGE